MGRIHSIETFGTVDGPGVRFVVFFQGCPMRCQYCHNPDTWVVTDGQEMSAEEILARMERNRAFYRTGGITATGGEPMLQIEFLTELFTKAKEKGIHTCLDTSGILFPGKGTGTKESLFPGKGTGTKESLFPGQSTGAGESLSAEKKAWTGQAGSPDQMTRLMGVTDLVMLDIKHMDDTAHRKLTGHSNQRILEFARYLDAIEKPVWIRHVVVPGITFEKEALTALGRFLSTLSNVEKLEVLPYHSMGKVKYDNLGLDYVLKNTPQLTKAEAKEAEEKVLDKWKTL